MWITLTIDDVLDQFNSTETAAFESFAGADTMPGLMTSVSNEVRGYARKRYALGAEGTIPDECKSAACTIIRHRFLNSVPDETLITEARTKEMEQAVQLLRDLAKGVFAIDATFSPADDEANTVGPSITTRTKTFTRADQDGI